MCRAAGCRKAALPRPRGFTCARGYPANETPAHNSEFRYSPKQAYHNALLAGGHFLLAGAFWFPVTPGDTNEDGGITLDDYEGFADCVSGEGTEPQDPICALYDSNGDGDIDLQDYSALQRSFSGPQLNGNVTVFLTRI